MTTLLRICLYLSVGFLALYLWPFVLVGAAGWLVCKMVKR